MSGLSWDMSLCPHFSLIVDHMLCMSPFFLIVQHLVRINNTLQLVLDMLKLQYLSFSHGLSYLHQFSSCSSYSLFGLIKIHYVHVQPCLRAIMCRKPCAKFWGYCSAYSTISITYSANSSLFMGLELQYQFFSSANCVLFGF